MAQHNENVIWSDVNQDVGLILSSSEESSDESTTESHSAMQFYDVNIECNRQREFYSNFKAASMKLKSLSDRWLALQKKRADMITAFRNDMRRVARKQLKIEGRLTKYSTIHAKKETNALKAAYETSTQCPICMDFRNGDSIIHFGCSHFVCKSCVLQLVTPLCPTCRQQLVQLHSFVKEGERYYISDITHCMRDDHIVLITPNQ